MPTAQTDQPLQQFSRDQSAQSLGLASARAELRSQSAKRLVHVMQLTDSLAAGGAERVAVNLANALPQDSFRTTLCTTRREGPLAELVRPHVGRLNLQRTSRFDLRALARLKRTIDSQRVDILHAHSSSLLVANLAVLGRRRPRVLWHDHFGRFQVESRSEWTFRLLTARAAGVIAVSQPLAQWSRERLGVPADRVWYLPNFPDIDQDARVPDNLPGNPGMRIVCVANLRPEKDHLTLVEAMRLVNQQVPDAHLLLVGSQSDSAQTEAVRTAIATHALGQRIHLLGSRRDVAGVLRGCDVGVLSSASEGLPLSLLEYGMAGLASVATDVGQCSEVLDAGRAGVVAPSRSPEALAAGMLGLLQSSQLRQQMARAFHERVVRLYSSERSLQDLAVIYDTVLADHSRGALKPAARQTAKDQR